jgi:hypothetical protein
MGPIIRARVSDAGTLLVSAAARALLDRHLATLKDKPVELVVRALRTQRSLAQNAYIHAVAIPLLAGHFGYDVPDMKLILMGECWGWHTVGGKELPVKAHTSEMTTEECSQFIEWVTRWAMTEHQLWIPLPSEVAA